MTHQYQHSSDWQAERRERGFIAAGMLIFGGWIAYCVWLALFYV